MTLKISDSEMNDDYLRYLRDEVKNIGRTILIFLLVISTAILIVYLIYREKDNEIKSYLWVSLLYIGASTVTLALSYLSVALNGPKYVDLFGPCI